MFVVAPILYFIGILGFLVSFAAALGLALLAYAAGVVGFGLLIYGVVAKSDLERAVLAKQAAEINQTVPSPQLQGKYCSQCITLNPLEAKFCNSCGKNFRDRPIS